MCLSHQLANGNWYWQKTISIDQSHFLEALLRRAQQHTGHLGNCCLPPHHPLLVCHRLRLGHGSESQVAEPLGPRAGRLDGYSDFLCGGEQLAQLRFHEQGAALPTGNDGKKTITHPPTSKRVAFRGTECSRDRHLREFFFQKLLKKFSKK